MVAPRSPPGSEKITANFAGGRGGGGRKGVDVVVLKHFLNTHILREW